MVAVHLTTDELPGVADLLEQRRRNGLDTYDEWWNGELRIVTGPTPEHGRLLNDLAYLLVPLARARGLHTAAPVNIGVDKMDCRVPDFAVFNPDTPRTTSSAFLATALLVVEVLSPGERSGAKLAFYRDHGVREYLEIDLTGGTAVLLLRVRSEWSETLDAIT